MNNKLKNLLRDFLPRRYQVPVKFNYNRLKSRLEPELDILKALVSKNDLAIDVGGNRGIYAYKLWRLGVKVEVFEPNSDCACVLEAWADGKQGVNVHSVALSSQSGASLLHIPIDESGVEHSASASIEHTDFKNVRDQEVVLKTLDSFGFENVSLIKIDVEGHELGVIEGAKQTIASSKPALLVEIEQRHSSGPIEDTFEKITSFGYEGFFGEKDGLKPLKNFDVDQHQPRQAFETGKGVYINNFLFLHSSKIAKGDYSALLENYKPA